MKITGIYSYILDKKKIGKYRHISLQGFLGTDREGLLADKILTIN